MTFTIWQVLFACVVTAVGCHLTWIIPRALERRKERETRQGGDRHGD